jgi:hypothetical protein
MMTSFVKKLLYALYLSLLLGAATTAAAQDKVKFLSTPDGSMTAYFVGANCAKRVEMLFEAKQPNAFDEATTPASRLMSNAVRVLSRQCTQLERITSKGVIGERILYSGIAEAATEWKLNELGVRSTSGVLSAEGESGRQEQFAKHADFATYSALSTDLMLNDFCARPDTQGTCSSKFVFSNVSPTAAHTTAHYLLDDSGAEAQLTYPGQETNGFLCSPTSEVDISVVGGELTADGRKDYSSMLRERVQSGGDRICVGFQKASARLLMGTFDSQGRSMGEPVPVSAATASTKLRLDQ